MIDLDRSGWHTPPQTPRGALARSLLHRMQDYRRRRRLRGRLGRFLSWVFGRRLRHGATRRVLLCGRRAYKVPRCLCGLTPFLRGWLANRDEAQTWRAVSKFYVCKPGEAPPAERLAPVLGTWLGGIVLVMARCEELTQADAKAYIFAEQDLIARDSPAAFDWERYCTDLHPGNLGRYEGRIVCLDYSV